MLPARPDSSRPAARRACAVVAALLAAVLGAGLVAAPGDAACRNVWQGHPNGESGLVLVCDGLSAGGSESKKKAAKPKAPTKAHYRKLRYVPSAAVSAEVLTELADATAAGPDAELIRAEVMSGTYLRDFQGPVRALGWSTRDFADQYAMAYIVLWAVVRNRDTVSDPVAKAVRADLRKRLALDGSVRRAGDAAKQAHVERLAAWSVILASDRNRAKASGDPEAMERVRRSARDLARQRDALGVDLANVMLSRKGALRTAGGPRVTR